MGTSKSTDTLLYSRPAQILFGQMPQTPHRSFGSKGENALILMTLRAYLATLQKLLSWPPELANFCLSSLKMTNFRAFIMW